jgi:hypothetical protein
LISCAKKASRSPYCRQFPQENIPHFHFPFFPLYLLNFGAEYYIIISYIFYVAGNPFFITEEKEGAAVKDLPLFVFLTQLGLSVALPLGGFIFLGIWLRQRFDLGVWVVLAGIFLGIVSAVDGLRVSLKAMERMTENKKQDPPPVSFNDHQ